MRPELVLAEDVHVVATTRTDGNQHLIGVERDLEGHAETADRVRAMTVRREIIDIPWTLVRQVHANTVVEIDHPEGVIDVEADALVTAARDVPIAMLGADCALVGFASDTGLIGVAHAGWRGLLSGVIGETVAHMRAKGAGTISAVIGPAIGAECYSFSEVDLKPLVERFGPSLHVRGSDGSHALDLVEGVARALEESDVSSVQRLGGCTVCDPRFFSWRAHRDERRHAVVVWRGNGPSESTR